MLFVAAALRVLADGDLAAPLGGALPADLFAALLATLRGAGADFLAALAPRLGATERAVLREFAMLRLL